VIKTLTDVSKSRILRQAIFIIGLFHVIIQLYFWYPACLNDHTKRDWFIYYAAAVKISQHASPYVKSPVYTAHQTPRIYLYSPAFALLLVPLSALSPLRFAQVWYALILAAYWVFCGALAKLSARSQIHVEAVLAWGLALAYTPGVYTSMAMGQADALVWAMFGLGVTWKQQFWLGLCAHIKPYYAWPLAVYGIRAEYKQLLTALTVMALGFLAALAVCGPGVFKDWYTTAYLVGSQGTFNSDNISLSFAGIRAARLCGWSSGPGAMPEMARIYLAVMSVMAPVAAAILSRPLSVRRAAIVTLIAALLFAPICWTAYLAVSLLLVGDGIGAALAKQNNIPPNKKTIAPCAAIPGIQ